jgi:hypothetical protein
MIYTTTLKGMIECSEQKKKHSFASALRTTESFWTLLLR